MKKRIFSAIILFGACGFLRAQNVEFESHTYLGLKGGFNYGTASFAHRLQRLSIVEGFQPGFHVGLMGINYLEKNVGIQVELNYTRKGWTQLFDGSVPNYSSTLDYIELPFMMNVYIGRRKTRLYFNFGWYFEYLLSVREKNRLVNSELFDFYPFDFSRDNRFGYGLVGGGGLYRDFSFGTLILQGGFAFGISNILNPVTQDSGIPNISNLITSTVSIGYLIKLGK